MRKALWKKRRWSPTTRLSLPPWARGRGQPRHCAPATSASAAETRPSELTAEEERGLRHQGRSHFPQVLLSASHRPQFRITPLDHVCSESIILSQRIGGRAHVGSNYEREIGHSVTNIYLFSFFRKKKCIPRVIHSQLESPAILL